MVYLSGASLPRLSWKKAVKRVCGGGVFYVPFHHQNGAALNEAVVHPSICLFYLKIVYSRAMIAPEPVL